MSGLNERQARDERLILKMTVDRKEMRISMIESQQERKKRELDEMVEEIKC